MSRQQRGTLRLMRLGIRFSTACTAAAQASADTDSACASVARQASRSITASSLASGWDSLRLVKARSYTLHSDLNDHRRADATSKVDTTQA